MPYHLGGLPHLPQGIFNYSPPLQTLQSVSPLTSPFTTNPYQIKLQELDERIALLVEAMTNLEKENQRLRKIINSYNNNSPFED